MQAVFIFNNLQVDTFNLNDAPFPGFELLTWEHESFIEAGLWDIGNDAGVTLSPFTKVYGQTWLTDSTTPITELQDFLQVPQSTHIEKVKIHIEIKNDLQKNHINGIVFALNEVKPHFKRLTEERWFLRRK